MAIAVALTTQCPYRTPPAGSVGGWKAECWGLFGDNQISRCVDSSVLVLSERFQPAAAMHEKFQ
jgi:hypothetical protein